MCNTKGTCICRSVKAREETTDLLMKVLSLILPSQFFISDLFYIVLW